MVASLKKLKVLLIRKGSEPVKKKFWVLGAIWAFVSPWATLLFWLSSIRDYFHTMNVFSLPILINLITLFFLLGCFATMFFLATGSDHKESK